MKEAILAWTGLNVKELHPLFQTNGSWENQRAARSDYWENWTRVLGQ